MRRMYDRDVFVGGCIAKMGGLLLVVIFLGWHARVPGSVDLGF